jgi:hypothetical protein
MQGVHPLAWELARHGYGTVDGEPAVWRLSVRVSTGLIVEGVGSTTAEAEQDLARKLDEWAKVR